MANALCIKSELKNPAMTNPSPRIQVKGTVHIGDLMDLVQTPSQPKHEGIVFDVGRPDSGRIQPVDYSGHGRRNGALNMQQLLYSLRPTKEQLLIEDDGLTGSYGIFGAPGCGKTWLMMYLLRQILDMHSTNAELKYGALILDPKAALIDDVIRMCEQTGRKDKDLIILNTDELTRENEAVNVIDCSIKSSELGSFLVLAAKGAGIAASEEFWFLAWSNLFNAALTVLTEMDDQVPTLHTLIRSFLTDEDELDPADPENPEQVRVIQNKLTRARYRIKSAPGINAAFKDAVSALTRFYQSSKTENIQTIEEFIRKAYGNFLYDDYRCFSGERNKALITSTFYDQIINEGKIVLVSFSPSEPVLAKTLCTVVKSIFQQTVLSRYDRFRAKKGITNFTRPLLLACDEYGDIASEVKGSPMGDGHFFKLARQNGCMGLMATQSVNVLKTAMDETWKSVFSLFAAKIFMRLADNETVEEATKLAGENDWYQTSQGVTQAREGTSISNTRDMRERKGLSATLLTQTLKVGEAVIIGSTNGFTTNPPPLFVRVPERSAMPLSGGNACHAGN
jgi:hypothetical protein